MHGVIADIIILILFVIIIAAFLYYKLNKAKIKGKIGENFTATVLSSLPDSYHVFNHLYFNIQGKSVQIDHLIISTYGIFVIETKNYKGWIFGYENSEYWTQNLYGTKYKLYNPVRQNKYHVNALSKLLGLPLDNFIPIVVFTNKASLHTHTESKVVYLSRLKWTIRRFTALRMNSDEVNQACLKIEKSRTSDKNKESLHIGNLKQRHSDRQKSIENNICPICGGTLIERLGKYGKFKGCSNYPRCKFTSKL